MMKPKRISPHPYLKCSPPRALQQPTATPTIKAGLTSYICLSRNGLTTSVDDSQINSTPAGGGGGSAMPSVASSCKMMAKHIQLPIKDKLL